MDVEHMLMLCLSTQCYVKRARPQNVDVVANRKMYSVEDDRVETDMPFTNSGMHATDGHEELRGPSVRIVPILVRYRVSFSTALVPHLHWTLSVQSTGELGSHVV
jgi:hypothetical protein